MRKSSKIIFILFLINIIPEHQIWAQYVTKSEALTVANNWIHTIINKKCNWGAFDNAQVEEIYDFTDGRRIIGYFCKVKPTGFIVISLRKELAPVKAYSARSNMEPFEDKGIAIIIRDRMERSLIWIEKQFGAIESVKTEDIENLLEISYKQSWNELLEGAVKSSYQSKRMVKSGNYHEGGILLSSQWHQTPPYNDQCPDMNCAWPMFGNFNQNALVGCAAVAGAQMMRYWSWPPKEFFNYDWMNMLDKYIYDGAGGFHDGSFSPCNNTQINAVAYLCGNVANRVDTDFGCEESKAYVYSSIFTSLFGVLSGSLNYNCSYERREDYSSGVAWFNYMKQQFNQNRPLIYQIMTGEDTRHAIVADGWQEIGTTPIRQYHINYGWAGIRDGWYTIDDIPNSNPDEEFLLGDLHPVPNVHDQISGDYFKSQLTYRYFDQDATGESATFYAGQKLQFLPGITVKCIGSAGACIQFVGRNTSTELNTYLFARGDLSKGIKLINADLKLFNGGCIQFQ